ncbi:hypothetical protein [Chamaesiphon sp. OTE_20_metabat_361]|uniref:hypothetical protein n=1 Tax=Chamaesiphon sp. OTE_20_metabat_361 TaxID=2964689 RepID=UPI002869EFD6|nr:hypothetical protein [Chamaesiphon sp. OTE_20_metabat_361]
MKLLLSLCFTLALTCIIVHPHVAIAGVKDTVRSQPQQPILGIADRRIVPGKRVGAIVKTTTHSDLMKLFGAKRLSESKFYGVEGELELPIPTTTIKFGNNRELQVIWKNSKRDRVFMTIVRDPDWQTKSGIRVGMTFPQLRKIAGKFQVSGLGWDYGNSVSFPALKTNPFLGMGIKVNADDKASEQFPEEYSAVAGDRLLADNDPRWQKLNMRVSALEIIYQ